MTNPPYVPPKVWTWDKSNGGKFASTNRPIAGATHEKPLPRGKHALQLYSLATPNGQKVTILLRNWSRPVFWPITMPGWSRFPAISSARALST